MDITMYLKAGYPCLHLVTMEPLRAIQTVETGTFTACTWDCLRGITDRANGNLIDDSLDPVSAIRFLSGKTDTVLFMQNFHYFLESVEVIQAVMNAIPIWKASGCCMVMSGPITTLPAQLMPFFTLLDFKLPDREALSRIQEELAETVGVSVSPAAVDAALGLTEFESETAFALSLVMEKRFSPEIITAQKMQMIRRTGLMEFWPPVAEEAVGGLGILKQYLKNRKAAFEPQNVHLPKPKALLLVGIPGTGKSLTCKAAASIFGWPLIRLDISALKGSLVGESEQRMRQATATIDAFGRAVVWIDEVEKAFSGVKSSGSTDGGTTASMFGHFLSWLQETTSPVLVMATANSLKDLPPEFLRAGRFDAMFFVDIPSAHERSEILTIMNARYGTEIPYAFTEKLSGWTGAEIEQLAKDSLFDGIEEAYRNIVPLSKTMKEHIEELQQWARSRARKANTPESEVADNINQKPIRRIL
jgi:hypothetical protein